MLLRYDFYVNQLVLTMTGVRYSFGVMRSTCGKRTFNSRILTKVFNH